MSDGGDQMVDKLVVNTDMNGKAEVYFRFGNTTHFTYHIKAKVEEGDSVTFELATGGYPGENFCVTDMRYWGYSFPYIPEIAIIGHSYQIHETCLDYEPLGNNVNNKWPLSVNPIYGMTIGWSQKLGTDSTQQLGSSYTDMFGVATMEVTIPAGAVGSTIFTVYSWSEGHYDAYPAARIKGVPEASLMMQMKRVTRDNQLEVVENDDPISPEDRAVIMHVANPTSYFYRLNMSQGQHLFIPVAAKDRDEVVVMQTEQYIDDYEFDLRKPHESSSSAEQFEFNYHDLDANTYAIKDGSLEEECSGHHLKTLYDTRFKEWLYLLWEPNYGLNLNGCGQINEWIDLAIGVVTPPFFQRSCDTYVNALVSYFNLYISICSCMSQGTDVGASYHNHTVVTATCYDCSDGLCSFIYDPFWASCNYLNSQYCIL